MDDNEDYSDSAMIALLPITSDWCTTDFPHLTLAYAGKVADLPKDSFNQLAKDATTIAMLSRTLTVPVTGVDYFGDQKEVKVLRLLPSPELLAMRRIVQRWDVSEYPFNPHCTVGPATTPLTEIPRMLAFDRVFVSYGSDDLTFWLKR